MPRQFFFILSLSCSFFFLYFPHSIVCCRYHRRRCCWPFHNVSLFGVHLYDESSANGNKILTRSNSAVVSSCELFSLYSRKIIKPHVQACARKLQLWIGFFFVRQMKMSYTKSGNLKKIVTWADNDAHIHDLLQLECSAERSDLCHLSGKLC